MLLCVLGGSDVALGPRDDLALFVGDGGAELGEAEQFEDAAAGVVEDSQVVALVQVVLDDGEVVAVPLLDEIERNLVGDELVDALGLQLCSATPYPSATRTRSTPSAPRRR